MFAGHYAAAMAAKAVEPRAPLWTYVAGCQLLDIGWSALVAAGIEKMRFDPSLPGSDLVLYDMPWTHSLPAAIAWSLGAAVLAAWMLRLPGRAAAMIGLVVFSHWLADLLVHRPDLLVWPGRGKIGLGLWNSPVLEEAVEIGLLALAGMAWMAQRVRAARAAWPAVAFMGLLLLLQLVGLATPGGGGSPLAFAGLAIVAYLVAAGAAALVDRAPASAATRLRERPVTA